MLVSRKRLIIYVPIIFLFVVITQFLIYLDHPSEENNYIYDGNRIVLFSSKIVLKISLLAELHEHVPENMRPFIHRSSANYTIPDLLNITQWLLPSSLNDDSHSSFKNPIHLIIQWYSEVNRRRRLELIFVLHVNVLNPAITKIHLIQNSKNCTIFNDIQDDPTFPLDLFRSKLVLNYEESIDPNQRLTISQVFRYSNRVIPDGYIILGNLDVIFDHSLLLLKSRALFPRQTVFYLSRYEIDPSISSLGLLCSNEHYVGSHDALIFQSPISNSIIEELPFEIGTWNIEVKIIAVLIQKNYQVKNPCKSIRIWHYHSSQVRHRSMPGRKYIPNRLLPHVMRPPEFLS